MQWFEIFRVKRYLLPKNNLGKYAHNFHYTFYNQRNKRVAKGINMLNMPSTLVEIHQKKKLLQYILHMFHSKQSSLLKFKTYRKKIFSKPPNSLVLDTPSYIKRVMTRVEHRLQFQHNAHCFVLTNRKDFAWIRRELCQTQLHLQMIRT